MFYVFPSPVRHVKHVRLGVSTCSSPGHPIKHEKHTQMGVFFVFASSLKHERHAHLGVSMCCFHFDTMRRACPLCCVFVSILTSVSRSSCRTGKKTGTGPDWTACNRTFGCGCLRLRLQPVTSCLRLKNMTNHIKTGCNQLQPVFRRFLIFNSI
jgi:hypothetical protein